MADYTKNYIPTEWEDGSILSASKLNNIEGFVTELDERTKDLKATKQDRIGRSGGGSSDYLDLMNKPRINGIELVGDVSLETLGIASATDLSALADLVGQANATLESLM